MQDCLPATSTHREENDARWPQRVVTGKNDTPVVEPICKISPCPSVELTTRETQQTVTTFRFLTCRPANGKMPFEEVVFKRLRTVLWRRVAGKLLDIREDALFRQNATGHSLRGWCGTSP